MGELTAKMSETVAICQIEKNLLDTLKKFRFSKSKKSCAIIMKVEKEERMIVEEDRIEECSTESLMEELPSHQPRFVVYSFPYTHKDGRVSYPMVFIFSSPPGGSVELNMMYAGSKINLVREAGMTKIVELRDL